MKRIHHRFSGTIMTGTIMNRCFVRHPMVLVLPALLAGCVSYSGISSQGQPLAAGSLQAAQTLQNIPLSEAAWPQRQWWNVLGDPRLSKLVEEALASSPDIQEVAARLSKANAQAEGANAERSPTVTAQAGVKRSRLSRSEDYTGEGDIYATVRSLGFGMAWSPDLWGGQRDAWKAAISQTRAAELDYNAAKLVLSVNVVRGYNQLASAWRLSDLAEHDVQRTSRLLELTEQAYRVGDADLARVSSARGLHASSQADEEGARLGVKIAALQLAALLGRDLDRALEIERPTPLNPAKAMLPSALPAELLGRRPDIIAARWRVEAASHDVEAVKTKFYPNINLVASGGTNSMIGDSLFGAVSRFWNIAPTVSLPIFDAGRLRAALKASDADYDAAVARYNRTVLDALHEVGQTVTRAQALASQVRTQQQARDMAQTAFDITMQRYKLGDASYLEALNIQQQLLQTDRQLLQLTSQQVDQSIVLMGALGGGFGADVERPSTVAAVAN